MIRSLDPHIIELESKIQILERENEALSAKAEENLLLNRAFEEINDFEDIDLLLQNTLESISVLLNIQFSGLFDFKDDQFTCVSSYALFSNNDNTNVSFTVSEKAKTKIAAKKTCLVNHNNGNFTFHYPDSGFVADHALIISIDSKFIKNRYFVFINDETENHLENRVLLFEKIIRIISNKLERIYYHNELVKLNEELERNVEIRTSELNCQNEEYLALNEEYKKMNEDLHMAKTEAEESEKKHRLLFENMTQGVLYQNASGIVLFSNAAAANILEMDHDQISGKISSQLFRLAKKEDGTELAEDEHPCMIAVRSGDKVTNFIMVVFIEKIKDYRWINSNAIPILKENSRKPHQVIVTFEDISERMRAEQEKLQKQQLEKEIAVAEESVRFKQNFLANMSHEIRTPLTGILGMTEILSNTSLNDEQSDYLNTIQQSGENLREIINNVLDFSKIEAGKMQLSKTAFKLKKVVNIARNLFVSICNKPIVFESFSDPNLPEFVVADPNRIGQVINNLISNAVKFTEEGKIAFRLELQNHMGSDVEIKISVTDTGRGIPEDQKAKLFTPFSQIDDRDIRQVEGTGLGLSICKELVSLHGGQIGVVSTPGQGSTFWFTFQATNTTEQPAAEKKSNKADLAMSHPQYLNILLSEDKVINQKVITLLLNSLGHKVTIASNGEEVLTIFEPDKFDLILMDIQMPVMDGITATQKLRSTYTQIPPIVGLSANAFEGDREKYMAQGLDEYLTKPFQKEEFLNVVYKLFHTA
jgi:two-component system, OmpR family, aerobic respiration control sensor histidine kinase ArcB